MAVFSKLRSAFRRKATDDDVTTVNVNAQADSKTAAPGDTVPAEKPAEVQDEPQTELQHGVRDMRAITATWSLWSLIALFVK